MARQHKEVTVMVKARLIDEQRFQARLAALDAAVRLYASEVSDGYGVQELAEQYEQWIMRPTERVPETEDAGPGRAECGAFLRPDWYTDAAQAARPWLDCCGEHSSASGRHMSEDGTIFHSHHGVIVAGASRCACGEPWPRAGDDSTDMRT